MLPKHFLEQLSGLEFELSAPLAPHTTFQIGGPADVLITLKTKAEVLHVIKACHASQLPIFILGGGSNLLISDEGLRAVVIHLAGDLAHITPNDTGDKIIVGAGASFPKLTRIALELGWESALGWNGTPGQVGGALKMNAGTRLGEIGQLVDHVTLATSDGFMTLRHDEIGFAYRSSAFPSDSVILEAELTCLGADRTKAPELLAHAQELAIKRKNSQPKMRSAGSIFKNPSNDFAGRLIEAAGLKGATEGRAQVSSVHANFIINLGGATAKDVYTLSQRVRNEVFQKFGIQLEYEVRLIKEKI